MVLAVQCITIIVTFRHISVIVDVMKVRDKNVLRTLFLAITQFLGRFLAERCNFIAMSGCLFVVCLSVMTRVYCDKMAEARIMQFSIKCSPMLSLLSAKFDDEIRRRSPRQGGSNYGGVVFDFAMHAGKRCEIELR